MCGHLAAELNSCRCLKDAPYMSQLGAKGSLILVRHMSSTAPVPFYQCNQQPWTVPAQVRVRLQRAALPPAAPVALPRPLHPAVPAVPDRGRHSAVHQDERDRLRLHLHWCAALHNLNLNLSVIAYVCIYIGALLCITLRLLCFLRCWKQTWLRQEQP